MKINVCWYQQSFQNIFSVLNGIRKSIIQKVQGVKNRVLRAYHEPSKPIPKLALPLHPIPNTYPKHYKKLNWPNYLDNARGASYANPNNVDGIAGNIEPLEKVTPLHAVTLGNNERGTYRLIADGGEIESRDIRGQTPSYWAAYQGNLEMLMRFKIYGANLGLKDFRGKTPLRAAVKHGHEKIIMFLATHGVNLNEFDGRGLTPLHLAAFHGKFSIYELLIYYNADRTLKDPLGRTAEDILKMKYAERYRDRCFIRRVFSSPEPPKLTLSPWKIEKLTARMCPP